MQNGKGRPENSASRVASSTFVGGPQTDYQYPAIVTRVTDGDTVGARVMLLDADLGFNVHASEYLTEKRWRLAGINAPEIGTQAGAAARAHLIELLGGDGTDPARPISCIFVTSKDRADDYGRYLATIITADGTNVNERMLADGFAEPWPKAA